MKTGYFSVKIPDFFVRNQFDYLHTRNYYLEPTEFRYQNIFDTTTLNISSNYEDKLANLLQDNEVYTELVNFVIDLANMTGVQLTIEQRNPLIISLTNSEMFTKYSTLQNGTVDFLNQKDIWLDLYCEMYDYKLADGSYDYESAGSQINIHFNYLNSFNKVCDTLAEKILDYLGLQPINFAKDTFKSTFSINLPKTFKLDYQSKFEYIRSQLALFDSMDTPIVPHIFDNDKLGLTKQDYDYAIEELTTTENYQKLNQLLDDAKTLYNIEIGIISTYPLTLALEVTEHYGEYFNLDNVEDWYNKLAIHYSRPYHCLAPTTLSQKLAKDYEALEGFNLTCEKVQYLLLYSLELQSVSL